MDAPTAAAVIDAPPATATAAPELTVVVPCYNERANVAPLVRRLADALSGVAWEVLFVDDDSPDGTAALVRQIGESDARVRCIRRIGRRGLSSAVIEGALASSAGYIAVMDGDLQHDETRLPAMLSILRDGTVDLVVGSRHAAGGDAAGLGSVWRHFLSHLGLRAAQLFLPVALSDPMSGFFLLPRPLFERLARRLTGSGFKIMLDLVLAGGKDLRIREVPFVFRPRAHGASKLDVQVAVQFAALLLDKLCHGFVPLRFISFACVGAFGVLVNIVALVVLRETTTLSFEWAQGIATFIAMLANFELNNRITYRDQRLRGRRLWGGAAVFVLVCAIGAVANIGIAGVLYRRHAGWTLAGGAGAAIGVVWNYAVSATLVWRAR